MSDKPYIVLENIHKTYPGQEQPSLKNVDLGIKEGEFLTLLGPSGSGKTTLLNIMAGFLDPTSGQMFINSVDITKLTPHKRNIGMVFQNYALFPHMTVAKNVAYPLRQRKVPKAERDQKVRAALDLVHLADKADNMPEQLSGGQQQRVALARAMIFEPQLLLMDEPLSALDKALRDDLRDEIRRLHRVLGKTVVYVTHDQDEALALSDRVAVVNGGEIVQLGTAQEVYEQPNSLFTAQFLGESTIIKGKPGSDAQILQTDFGPLRIPKPVDAGRSIALMIRPEHTRLAPASDCAETRPKDLGSGEDFVSGTVDDIIYKGGSRTIRMTLGNDIPAVSIEYAGKYSAITKGGPAFLVWDINETWLVPT